LDYRQKNSISKNLIKIIGYRLGLKSEKSVYSFSKLILNEIIRTKEARTMKQLHAYEIDLTKLEGNGDFACPRRGTKISPDDY
jgi:hypothetical protein